MAYHNHYKDVGFARGKISPRQAIERIRAMGEKVLASAKAELKKGAEVVVADAKSRCPVDTGRLRDSIKAVPNKDGSAYFLVADAYRWSLKRGAGKFYYGQIVEFSPKEGYRPFLYPAIEAHWREIQDNIDAVISRAARGA